MSFYLFGRKYTLGAHDVNQKNLQQPPRLAKFPFSTAVAKKSQSVETGLLDHFTCSTNPPEDYKCYYCNFKTDVLVEFNNHVAKTKMKPSINCHSAIILYTCDNCSFETFSRLVLLKHAHMKCAANTSSSLLILAAMKDTARPHKHVKLIHSEKQLLKQNANATDQKQAKCPKPQKPKKPRRILLCERCSFQTRNYNAMNDHKIRKHTLEKDIIWHQCRHCPFKAKLKNLLHRHLFEKHTSPDKVVWFKCSECSYQTVWKLRFTQHYNKVHFVEKLYECDKCPHKTKYSSHFKRHMKEHHSVDFKWFQCEHCPYKARQKIHMKLHTVQRHTPEEDIEWYKCEQCSYKAKIKASLKNHVLKKHVSLEEIPWFVCEKCGYKVKEKSLLKKHLQKKHNLVNC